MSGWIAIGAAVLLALAVVVYDRWRTARTIRRLDDMLTAAINGTFSEETFDESRLSSLESRLARYLAASALSARNVREQKDQISALVSDISHQTKTPVANLRLYAQLLSEQPLTLQGKDCAAAISAQAEKLQTLIEALVKTSRLETGILALHPQPGEISPVVERAAAQYAPKAVEKGIALTVGQRAGSAVFDAKWTEEAVCNLLDNAVKYTPSGAAVTVEVKNYELFSAIRVSDTGPGISEEEQAKIFGRFYRASGAWQAEGVGIGLYLTRQIAEKQGGYVKVESIPGKGSTFSLYIPRES
jgi:signal transduction histidine kinase